MKLFMSMALLVSLTGAGAALGDNPMGKPDEAKGSNVVVMETSKGAIKIELFENKAPITVKNFLTYVDEKHFDGTVFHRVIPNFMIQGGGLDEKFNEKKTRDPIKNESSNGLSNKRGTIAMARTNDPDSATSQFFINVVDNERLDRSAANAGYCVFGKVIEGMDVVDAIRKVKTARTQVSEGQPVENVVIKSVRRAK
jgi:cyclophilin family peptidyl-prolyl cis-trans isomerase